MVPLVGFKPELVDQEKLIRETAEKVFKEKGIKVEYMQQFLQKGLPPDRYTLDCLENGNDLPYKILAYYANLETGPDEALLFYYVGHGGMQRAEAGRASDAGRGCATDRC